MKRALSTLPLVVMGLAATMDRALLAEYGRASWWWVPVYGVGYAVLVVLTVLRERAGVLAVMSAVECMASQNALIAAQQKRIEELEGS